MMVEKKLIKDYDNLRGDRMLDLNLKIIIDRIKIDFKKATSINAYIDTLKYIYHNRIYLLKGALDLIMEQYKDYDDIECNIESIIELNSRVEFKELNISFVADTYTKIKVIFTDDTYLELAGDNGDYNRYNYSFDAFKRMLKYKNRIVKEIRAYGSLGSEEFRELSLNIS